MKKLGPRDFAGREIMIRTIKDIGEDFVRSFANWIDRRRYRPFVFHHRQSR
jgi:hypothetical protein